MSYIVPRDIPRGCERCPFNGHTKCRMMPIGFDEYPLVGKRPDWCPLIEVETPHGRLIDADMLKSKFRHGKGDDDIDSAWISTIRRFITQADTIIERSEE